MFSETLLEKDKKITNPTKNDGKITKRIICNSIKGANDTTDLPKENTTDGREILNNYLECSTVHGVKYFGNLSIKVGTYGKFIWTCVMVTSFICLSLMVIQFLRRYSDNPTNTFVRSFYAPIDLVPFPAVTICPYTPPLLERRLNILESLRLPANLSSERAMLLLKYSHDIARPSVSGRYKYMDDLKALLNENGFELVQLLRILRPCEDIVDHCFWNGKRINCADSMKISHSAQGVCCSFNYLLEDYMQPERDVEEPEFLHTNMYGPRTGLRLILKREILETDDDLNDLSRTVTNSNGVLVCIHHTIEFLGDEIQPRLLQANRELQIRLRPWLLLRPSNLYHHSKGHTIPICISNDARTKYFPKYRYSNCYASCRIDIMIQMCGCVLHNYDPVRRQYHMKSCELDGLKCINDNIRKIRLVKDVFENNFTCICQTSCENVYYSEYPSTIDIQEKHLTPTYQNMSDGQAVLQVFMESQVFQILETLPAADEIYLLASIGGIFSLFLGCSFLSIVELIYFGGLISRAVFRRSKRNASPRKRQVSYKNFEDTESCCC